MNSCSVYKIYIQKVERKKKNGKFKQTIATKKKIEKKTFEERAYPFRQLLICNSRIVFVWQEKEKREILIEF